MEREIQNPAKSERRKEPGCERETEGSGNGEMQKLFKKA